MAGWNTCYGDGGDGYRPVEGDFEDERRRDAKLLREKGACPVCGCEELDHRDLWTCQCPSLNGSAKP